MVNEKHDSTNIELCPFTHSVCASDKCKLWQQYSRVFYIETGTPGECLIRLATCAIMNKYDPQTVNERFPDDENELDDPIEVPFPY